MLNYYSNILSFFCFIFPHCSNDGELVSSLADESFNTRIEKAVTDMNTVFNQSFFSLIPTFFSPIGCSCCLSIGVMVIQLNIE